MSARGRFDSISFSPLAGGAKLSQVSSWRGCDPRYGNLLCIHTTGEKPNALLLCIATVLGWLFVGRRSSD
jgi:hypothetical protein